MVHAFFHLLPCKQFRNCLNIIRTRIYGIFVNFVYIGFSHKYSLIKSARTSAQYKYIYLYTVSVILGTRKYRRGVCRIHIAGISEVRGFLVDIIGEVGQLTPCWNVCRISARILFTSHNFVVTSVRDYTLEPVLVYTSMLCSFHTYIMLARYAHILFVPVISAT